MKIRLIGIVLDLGLDLDHGYDRSHDDDDHTIIRWETVRCLSWFMDSHDNDLDLGDDRVGYDYHGDGRCSL